MVPMVSAPDVTTFGGAFTAQSAAEDVEEASPNPIANKNLATIVFISALSSLISMGLKLYGIFLEVSTVFSIALNVFLDLCCSRCAAVRAGLDAEPGGPRSGVERQSRCSAPCARGNPWRSRTNSLRSTLPGLVCRSALAAIRRVWAT